MKIDLFQSWDHWRIFQICWHIECSTFTASSFRIWDSSDGVPSPLLALIVELPYDPTIPLLGMYPEKTIIERDTCTPIFIAALFTWKQPRCPSTDEWIKKLSCVYTMEYYSDIKKSPFVFDLTVFKFFWAKILNPGRCLSHFLTWSGFPILLETSEDFVTSIKARIHWSWLVVAPSSGHIPLGSPKLPIIRTVFPALSHLFSCCSFAYLLLFSP